MRIQNEIQDNEEIDIEIKAPMIAKGKSADLINNTMFIMRNLTSNNMRNGVNTNMCTIDEHTIGEQQQKQANQLDKDSGENNAHIQK